MNGAGHLLLSATQGRYFPGAATVPLCLLVGIGLLTRLFGETQTRRHREQPTADAGEAMRRLLTTRPLSSLRGGPWLSSAAFVGRQSRSPEPTPHDYHSLMTSRYASARRVFLSQIPACQLKPDMLFAGLSRGSSEGVLPEGSQLVSFQLPNFRQRLVRRVKVRTSRGCEHSSGGILLSMTLEECRQFYSEEIRFAANITSATLIEAFARVPREHFLGSGPWKIASVDFALGGTTYIHTSDADPRHLYHNVPVALDPTRDLNNGQPAALAKWIDALGIKNGMRVYHLGCGVGYFTAIMAEMVGQNGSVVATEIDPELAARASKNLAGYPNVSVHSGDGADFDPGECDAMLINAGVTHPHARWLESLNVSGSLVLPLTIAAGMGMGANLGKGIMAKITRQPKGFSANIVSFVAIYSCVGMRDTQLEEALGKAMGTGNLFKLRSLRRDVHELTDTCLVHGTDICLSSEEIGARVAA